MIAKKKIQKKFSCFQTNNQEPLQTNNKEQNMPFLSIGPPQQKWYQKNSTVTEFVMKSIQTEHYICLGIGSGCISE